jgi:selenoprotein W-related protein
LAAAIKTAKRLPVELVKGSGGTFLVSVDGRVLFSKLDEGRFPDDDEILDQL